MWILSHVSAVVRRLLLAGGINTSLQASSCRSHWKQEAREEVLVKADSRFFLLKAYEKSGPTNVAVRALRFFFRDEDS